MAAVEVDPAVVVFEMSDAAEAGFFLLYLISASCNGRGRDHSYPKDHLLAHGPVNLDVIAFAQVHPGYANAEVVATGAAVL